MKSGRFAAIPIAVALSLALGACTTAAERSASSNKVSDLMIKALNAESGDNPTLATKYFYDVLELEPQNKLAYFNLGVIAQNQENYGAAEANFRIALKIDPNFTLAQKNLAKVQELRSDSRR